MQRHRHDQKQREINRNRSRNDIDNIIKKQGHLKRQYTYVYIFKEVEKGSTC